ncbi:MAG: hypothetical protein QXO51_06350 [Halobacteria archaeon]
MEIEDLLRKGPKTAEEVALLAKVSVKTAYKNLYRLAGEGRVLVYPMPDGHRWRSLFVLPDHHDLAASITGFAPCGRTSGIESRVLQALERLRALLLREPEVEEVLRELGEDPEDRPLRSAVYRVGSRAGWVPPAPREKEAAEARLQRLLRIASWVKKGRLRVEIAEGMSREEIEEARKYLEKFPERVPG